MVLDRSHQILTLRINHLTIPTIIFKLVITISIDIISSESERKMDMILVGNKDMTGLGWQLKSAELPLEIHFIICL